MPGRCKEIAENAAVLEDARLIQRETGLALTLEEGGTLA
jgi:hypothetical protein